MKKNGGELNSGGKSKKVDDCDKHVGSWPVRHSELGCNTRGSKSLAFCSKKSPYLPLLKAQGPVRFKTYFM